MVKGRNRRIEEFAPDLVILDWNLPGLSGIEICCRLRACGALHDLPVIMLTGRAEEEDRENALSFADDYVVKPFYFSELIARARALLRRTRPTRAATKLVGGDLVLNSDFSFWRAAPSMVVASKCLLMR